MSARTRKKYSEQFKLDAIRMYENGEKPKSQIERELGITAGLLGKWQEKLLNAEKPGDAFPGNGKQAQKDERIRQLERENMRLRQEREILKKVLGIYARDT